MVDKGQSIKLKDEKRLLFFQRDLYFYLESDSAANFTLPS
jgi:hypothetical protein